MKNITLVILLTAALTGCSKENLYNESASLSDSTDISHVLEGQVITTTADKNGKTMATLYGNAVASQYARNSSGHQYPAGSELSLVTWIQKEDIHWYGANIPGEIKSIEIIKYVKPDSATLAFYEGKKLRLQKLDVATTEKRIDYISSQRAAVLP